MSLIHTCQLNGANPFHYLTELQKHAANWPPPPRLDAVELPPPRWKSGQGRPSG